MGKLSSSLSGQEFISTFLYDIILILIPDKSEFCGVKKKQRKEKREEKIIPKPRRTQHRCNQLPIATPYRLHFKYIRHGNKNHHRKEQLQKRRDIKRNTMRMAMEVEWL